MPYQMMTSYDACFVICAIREIRVKINCFSCFCLALPGVILVFRFAQNRMHLGITQASLVLHSVFTVFV